MKLIKTLVALGYASLFLTSVGIAAEKQAKKLTCCQEAAANGKDCSHKCCMAAHKQDKSCEKCNPNKEDLKLKKAAKKPS
jgi:hypothetical protein